MYIVSVYIVFLSSGGGVVSGLLQQASYFIWEAGEEQSQVNEGWIHCLWGNNGAKLNQPIHSASSCYYTTTVQSPSSAPAVLFTAQPYVLSHSSKHTADLLCCQEFVHYSLCLWTTRDSSKPIGHKRVIRLKGEGCHHPTASLWAQNQTIYFNRALLLY